MPFSPAQYHFVSTFAVEASAPDVWKALIDFKGWKGWWRGVRSISIEKADYPQAFVLSVGVAVYSLKVRLAVSGIEEGKSISLTSTGDLLGAGKYTLSPVAGGTQVEFRWDVVTTKNWMNAGAPVLRPLFVLSHGVTMRWFARGMARKLGVRLVFVNTVSK